MLLSDSDLPYEYDQLSPFLSEYAVRLHHEQHQREYLKLVNTLARGTRHSTQSLSEIILSSEGRLFFYAAEIWNHQFFWRCLRPLKKRPSPLPSTDLLDALEQEFQTFERFKRDFETAAMDNRNYGWTWLVRQGDGQLNILSTPDALTPLLDMNSTPLLAIDVWEHAYYLDYHNDKRQYLANFWPVTNWEFVNRIYSGITSNDSNVKEKTLL